MIRSFTAAGLVALSLVAAAAQGQVVVFDTGPSRTVQFDASGQSNFATTYVGYGAGNLAAGQEQRWSAQPFVMPAGSWDLTQIDANYFHLNAAAPPEQIGIRIWSRNGQNAPGSGDELFIGTVPAPMLIADPRMPGNPAYLAELNVSALNINLSGGDYYLSLFGVHSSQGSGGIGWLANPEFGINLVNPASGAFMWRSVQYPSPGFTSYQLGAGTLQQMPGLDPNDVYGSAFTIYAVPAPGAMALLGLGGFVAARRRR
jgi:hypothetical protein